MTKVSINSLLLLRRVYSNVAAENVKVQTTTAASMMKKVTDSRSSSSLVGEEVNVGESKEVFWMRDPKTGNWIPETHFDDVDVAELREKLLFNKEKVVKFMDQ